jgi:hypothetical protein
MLIRMRPRQFHLIKILKKIWAFFRRNASPA